MWPFSGKLQPQITQNGWDDPIPIYDISLHRYIPRGDLQHTGDLHFLCLTCGRKETAPRISPLPLSFAYCAITHPDPEKGEEFWYHYAGRRFWCGRCEGPTEGQDAVA